MTLSVGRVLSSLTIWDGCRGGSEAVCVLVMYAAFSWRGQGVSVPASGSEGWLRPCWVLRAVSVCVCVCVSFLQVSVRWLLGVCVALLVWRLCVPKVLRSVCAHVVGVLRDAWALGSALLLRVVCGSQKVYRFQFVLERPPSLLLRDVCVCVVLRLAPIWISPFWSWENYVCLCWF